MEGFFGNAPEAKRNAMAALDLSKGRDVEYGCRLCAGPLGRFLPGTGTRGRSGKSFPGTYVRPTQLFACASRIFRIELNDPKMPSSSCKSPSLTISRKRASSFLLSLGTYIRPMCVARRFSPRIKAPKLPRNSRKFSITAGLCSAIP